MAKQNIAGAVIIDRIRERITSGRYLGTCRPGQRLPSIREIAEAEGVNRKTVAAAYLRLQSEGLVQIRARSGIYLAPQSGGAGSGPLDRLHRQWLEQTVSGARALGLQGAEVLKMLVSVSSVERSAIPVVESNRVEAAAIAAELSARLGIRAVPVLLSEFRRSDVAGASQAPHGVVVTTPWHAAEVADVAQGRTVIDVALDENLVRDLSRIVQRPDGIVIAGSDALAGKIRRALAYQSDRAAAVAVVSTADELHAALARGCSAALLWPGTPASLETLIPRDLECIRPSTLLSAASVERVQSAVLDASIRISKTVPAGAPLTATVTSAPLPQHPAELLSLLRR